MEHYQARTGTWSKVNATTAYISKVYIWMTEGLVITGLTAWYLKNMLNLREWPENNLLIVGAALMLQAVILYILHAFSQKMPTIIAVIFFIIYAIIVGFCMSIIFILYPVVTISNAFFTAAGMFLAMSVYGTVTKRDLTGWGSFLTMGLCGAIIAVSVNIILENQLIDYVASCISVIVFIGLIALDTQKLRDFGVKIDANDTSSSRRWIIVGALTLYLDFLNLFFWLLRLFGGRGRN